MDVNYLAAEKIALTEELELDPAIVDRAQAYAAKQAKADTDKSTHQAMEAFIHNLNTMHSRAGAQTPFSSINYGMDTSAEGRMVIRNILKATEEGLGNGETPIFPIQIFRVKEGVNYNVTDPNYDLFKQACAVSAKRLFPNFSFLDASFNAPLYKGTLNPRLHIWVVALVSSATSTTATGRSPRRGESQLQQHQPSQLAIRSKGDIELFFEMLEVSSVWLATNCCHVLRSRRQRESTTCRS